ncbi:[4Fe-4S] proteins maturation [Coniothyrium glycines]
MPSRFTMCHSCFHALQRAAPKPAARSVQQANRTYLAAATGRPLYLDFLAPSYTPASSIRRSVPSLQRPSFAHYQRSSRQTFATTSDPSTAKPAQAVKNPRTDDSGNPMLISISPRASHRLYTIGKKDNNPDLALRVTIESGGCHGFQYLMDLTDLGKAPAGDDDTVFEGEKGEKVVIDESSLELLNGSTVDYTMELIGSQFKITGIPGATSSCGCGTSFDIKL